MQAWRNIFTAETDAETRALLNHGAAIAGAIAVGALLWAFGADAATSFLLFVAATAFAAWMGGAECGIVAMLASILVMDVMLRTTANVIASPWLAFAAATLLITWLIARDRERIGILSTDLETAQQDLRDVSARERHAQLLNVAYDRLSAAADDAACFALTAHGAITAWTGGAAQMYGRADAEMIGVGAQALFGAADATSLQRILADAGATGCARWSGIHRRRDGTPFDVDLEIRAIEGTDTFTAVVRDLTRDREWAAFRDASSRSESALREEAELMRRQLAALESVTDPMLDMSNRDEMEQLLERLRVAIDADGIALLLPPVIRKRLVTANGVQPSGAASRAPADTRRAANRVQLIQNDPSRMAQASVLEWPETASCLIAVPIPAGGSSAGVLEVVNERPRRATDADMALIRVVANRVATVGSGGYADKNAVA